MADTTSTNAKQNTNPNASAAQSPLFTGRKKIYWIPVDLSIDENVLDAVEQTMIAHQENRAAMLYLQKYEKGDQPIFYRVKTIREDVNVHCMANYAKLITDFKVGYEFASPIMFVQRAADDFTKADVRKDDKRVSSLNEMLWEQDKAGKDIELAHDFKTTGLGYMLVYPKREKSDDIAPFDLVVLNPLNTYVVYSNDAYQRKMMAVTYSWIPEMSIARITAYTPDWVYEILGNRIVSKLPNMIGKIPIVEYRNDANRMACFEAIIPLADALNIANSDRVNDISQYVQAILWLHNCAIDPNQKDELRNGGFIQTTTTADGKEAKVTYVTSALNQQETQALVDYLYDQMLEIAGVPGRDSASGGNTGAAILLSNGWQLAETMAKTMEPIFAASEMEMLDIIIAIFKNSPNIPEDLKALRKSDVIVKFSRNKTYDLVSRTVALANLINIGIEPGKAISTVDIFDDAQQVTLDSLEMINKLLLGKINKNTENEPQNGDGISVDGVKGADDHNVEQNRENASAV